MFEEEDQTLKRYQTQFFRHKKLENLQLKFFNSKYSIFKFLTQQFDHLPNLQNIEIVSIDAKEGKNLIENIKKAKSLRSITLYYHVEPNDLFSILAEIPDLQKLIIKDDWLFINKAMPILDTLSVLEINLTHLHLDLPMDIDNNNDVQFIVSFLSILDRLCSLKLCLRSITDGSLLYIIAKSINKMRHLQELILGIVVSTEQVADQILQLMKDLNKLQRISIMFRPAPEEIWLLELPSLFRTLTSFITRNKALTELSIFWEKLTPQGMECMRDLIAKLPSLNYLKIVYTSSYKSHGKNHESTMSELEKALKMVKSMNKVTVTTTCQQYTSKNCESKGTGMTQVLALSENIKRFSFQVVGKAKTPFYGETI